MYEGIVTKITNVRPHPNADRINIGTAAGHQVVIGKDTDEGTMGVFFPCDGRLTEDCLKSNNLYGHTHLNADPDAKGGFFDDNGRVRAQKFRGEVSEGFWTGLGVLSWTGVDLSALKQGGGVSKVNGHVVCQKYYTPATMRAMKQGKKSKKEPPRESFPLFREHFGVGKLRKTIGYIPVGAELVFSEKCHGTSGRTGRLPVKRRSGWFGRMRQRLFPAAPQYKYVTGSRRVVLDMDKVGDGGFYSGKTFRVDIHKRIEAAGLHKGETVYYEIVGFDEAGGPIMPPHKPTDKALKKRYGDVMHYSYGCYSDYDPASQRYKVLVYRITNTTPDGHIIELPWHQVVHRSGQIGLDAVKELDRVVYDGDGDALLKRCECLSRGDSSFSPYHIKEGVVVRVQAPGAEFHCKFKSFHFCDLEGIAKNNDEYVDPEEVS